MQNSAYSAGALEIQSEIASYQRLNDDIMDARERAELVQKSIKKFEEIVKSKPNWINFFTDLQTRLFDVKDAWVDKLEVVRSVKEVDKKDKKKYSRKKNAKKVVILEPDFYVLKLSGRMLLRKETGSDELGMDKEVAIKRLESLKKSIAESEFVDSVITDALDPTPRVLVFTLDININADKPL